MADTARVLFPHMIGAAWKGIHDLAHDGVSCAFITRHRQCKWTIA